MANSKYEYVKSLEEDDEINLHNIIIVRVDGRDFRRFSEVHEFETPNDEKALELMNECAKAVLEQFPDIIFSYGYSDEFSFIFKKATEFYQRRASKINSVVVSFFTSVYVQKWKTVFKEKDLRYAPSFRSQVIPCASLDLLQAYLFWRQHECHWNNLHDTCLWHMIKSGESENKAKGVLKGFQKQDRNELLFQVFKINYKKDIPEIFRQGTCVLKRKVEEIVKYKNDGFPVKRPRQKVITVHSESIASTRFWNDHLCLLKEFGQLAEDLNEIKPEYVKSFQKKGRLKRFVYNVIRIDGCHFHRFSEVHEYEKPNDAIALNLMNSCAAGILEEFKDIVFAYGVSDEYSFVLKKDTQLYESEIVSAVVSLFSSMFTTKWKEFFPNKNMKSPPYFDARVIWYPSSEILRDYLAWRQVDCHINNQYNTCFWMLVKSGKSKTAAQSRLKGTQTHEKNELLDKLSGTTDYYSTLPSMFRYGSSVYWDKDTKLMGNEEGHSGTSRKIVVVGHCDIIDASFWEAHPEILT